MPHQKPQLLAPAGDMEKLFFALKYGADAAYIGGSAFSLRANATNFELEEIKDAVNLTHRLGKKIYLAVNIFAKNRDLEQLREYLSQINKTAIDALIVSDPGVFTLARELAPDIPIHISTQANNTNWLTCRFWKELGAKRIVLARELSLTEVKEISAKTDLETEIFIHGAMCVSYSGRCLLSNYLISRDSNQGDCAHPCRWQYQLVEEKRPGKFLPIFEDERGSYIMNAKDLCLLSQLKEILDSGATSLKIEGRNKSAYYVANVTRVYREAIDTAFREGADFRIRQNWLDELAKVSHREYSSGFALNYPTHKDQRYEDISYIREYDFAGVLKTVENGYLIIEQRNNLKVGDIIEILLPDNNNLSVPVSVIIGEDGEKKESAPHPKEIIKIPFNLDKIIPLPLIVRRRIR